MYPNSHNCFVIVKNTRSSERVALGCAFPQQAKAPARHCANRCFFLFRFHLFPASFHIRNSRSAVAATLSAAPAMACSSVVGPDTVGRITQGPRS